MKVRILLYKSSPIKLLSSLFTENNYNYILDYKYLDKKRTVLKLIVEIYSSSGIGF